MTSGAHCLLMATYNEWMNTRLYALCATLYEEELRRERGAFFGSIERTLNHIVYGDLSFLSRMTGDPPQVPALGADLFESFHAMHAARTALDARLIAWAATLSDAWLAERLSYTSKIDGKTRAAPNWVLVAHMFNHQTHHRGQVTTLLAQMGLDMGSTDIPFMAQFDSTSGPQSAAARPG